MPRGGSSKESDAGTTSDLEADEDDSGPNAGTEGGVEGAQ